jgi:cytochrome c2
MYVVSPFLFYRLPQGKEFAMKKISIFTAALLIAGGLSFAYAANIDKGKALFESPTLGGGTTGKSCKTCHAGGRNFGADLFERKQLTIMGKKVTDVAAIINVCIEKPLGGTAIDTNGEEMQDLIAYMKTLLVK